MARVAARDWLNVREASAALGVAPNTLRRWSDAGRVPTFTTPGGHRRFDPRVLRDFVAVQQTSATVSLPSAARDKMRSSYRARLSSRRPATESLLSNLSDSDRVELRDRGRRLAETMLEYLQLQGSDEASMKLAEAGAQIAVHARIAARSGIGLPDLIRLFLSYRSPFLQELGVVARGPSATPEATAKLMLEASSAFDHLLVALVSGYLTLEPVSASVADD